MWYPELELLFETYNLSCMYSVLKTHICLLAIYSKYAFTLSAHESFMHLKATPSLSSFVPQHGHISGMATAILSGLVLTTLITCGIISAAFSTRTMSPYFRFFSRSLSTLCKLALDITEPDTSMGSMIATGVIVPFLPTCQRTSIRAVTPPSGLNL